MTKAAVAELAKNQLDDSCGDEVLDQRLGGACRCKALALSGSSRCGGLLVASMHSRLKVKLVLLPQVQCLQKSLTQSGVKLVKDSDFQPFRALACALPATCINRCPSFQGGEPDERLQHLALDADL